MGFRIKLVQMECKYHPDLKWSAACPANLEMSGSVYCMSLETRRYGLRCKYENHYHSRICGSWKQLSFKSMILRKVTLYCKDYLTMKQDT